MVAARNVLVEAVQAQLPSGHVCPLLSGVKGAGIWWGIGQCACPSSLAVDFDSPVEPVFLLGKAYVPLRCFWGMTDLPALAGPFSGNYSRGRIPSRIFSASLALYHFVQPPLGRFNNVVKFSLI